jgi:hypothetical protein
VTEIACVIELSYVLAVRWIEPNYVSLSSFIAITVVAWGKMQVRTIVSVIQCVFIHGAAAEKAV